MQWDVFCRVVDNFGDIGVCWRLAADLASRGETVRLWVDDARGLQWMAPAGAPGVEVRDWPSQDVDAPLGDVVVEAFGCALPPFVESRMAQRRPFPVWLNLEYLSAEPYVERSHGLPSPQRNGLTKWFFYPGFTPGTGGLLREPGLLASIDALDETAWLARHGIERRAGERLVSLFCYDNPALPALAEALAERPTLLLAAGEIAQAQVRRRLDAPAVRIQDVHPLPQTDYDRLLRCCDLNLVRGEDSFVRAQWAGRPFLWQIYPQDDGAHAAKLDAFLDHFLDGAAPALATSLRTVFHRWNGLGGAGRFELPPLPEWQDHTTQWRENLTAQPDLSTQLARFVAGRRNEGG